MSSLQIFPLQRSCVIIFSIASLAAIVIVVAGLSIASTPTPTSDQKPKLLSSVGEEKTMPNTRAGALDTLDKSANLYNPEILPDQVGPQQGPAKVPDEVLDVKQIKQLEETSNYLSTRGVRNINSTKPLDIVESRPTAQKSDDQAIVKQQQKASQVPDATDNKQPTLKLLTSSLKR